MSSHSLDLKRGDEQLIIRVLRNTATSRGGSRQHYGWRSCAERQPYRTRLCRQMRRDREEARSGNNTRLTPIRRLRTKHFPSGRDCAAQTRFLTVAPQMRCRRGATGTERCANKKYPLPLSSYWLRKEFLAVSCCLLAPLSKDCQLRFGVFEDL